jgi:hypothetical protein
MPILGKIAFTTVLCIFSQSFIVNGVTGVPYPRLDMKKDLQAMPFSPRNMVLLLIDYPNRIDISFIAFFCAVHLPSPEI